MNKKTLDSEVLGQLLYLQSVMDVMPTEEGLIALTCEGLRCVPGVNSVEFKNTDNATSECIDSILLPVTAINRKYGNFCFATDNKVEFEPYIPYLQNLTNYISTIFENRYLMRELNRAHEVLELRIEERTEELVREIAEHKKTVEELHQFEHIVSNSSDMLTFLDKSFTYITANSAYMKAFNKTYGELIGHTVSEVFGKVFFNDMIRPHAERCLAGDRVNFKTWVDLPAYKSRYMDINYYPYFDKNKMISGFVVNARDITDNKRAEEAIISHATRYQTLFNNSPVPLWEEDFAELNSYLDELKAKGVRDFGAYFDKHPDELQVCARKVKILDVNKAAIKLHGAKDKTDLLSNLQQIFTKRSYDVFREEVIAIAMGRSEHEAEAEVKTLAGERRDIALKLSLSSDKVGPNKALIATMDITRRKHDEKALFDSKERLDEAQRVAGLGYYLFNVPTGLWTNSRQLDDILGINEDYRRDIRGWLNIVHPDDREAMKQYLRDDVLSQGLKFDREYRIIDSRTNELRWVHGLGSLRYDEDGRPVEMFGTIQDITSQKENEIMLNQSKHIVSGSTDMLALLDKNLSYLYVNPAFARAFNKSAVELFGSTPNDLFGESFFTQHLEPNAKKCLNGEHVRFATWLSSPVLGRKFMEVNFSPYIGIDNTVKGIVANWRDITIRKRVEDEWTESVRRLREVSSHILNAQEEERKRLSSELHDGLVQELAVLKLQLNSTKKAFNDESDGDKREFGNLLSYIDQIIENTRRLSHNLSPAILEDLGLSVAIKQLIGNFKKDFNGIVSAHVDDIHNIFKTDHSINIYRILQECLHNITKHSQATQVTINIEKQKDKDRVVFMLTDNGVGFTPDSNPKADYEDAGIGLITLKERLLMLNATFDLSSQPGEGTSKVFTIPAHMR